MGVDMLVLVLCLQRNRVCDFPDKTAEIEPFQTQSRQPELQAAFLEKIVEEASQARELPVDDRACTLALVFVGRVPKYFEGTACGRKRLPGFVCDARQHLRGSPVDR